MTVEENKILVRRYYDEAPNNPEICDEIYAPTFYFHTLQHASVTGQVIKSTPKSEKESYEWLKGVWSSDWHLLVEEMIAEGDRVMVRWTFHGTHLGEYYGLPPTHKQVSYSGINIFRIADGKIVEI
ncbi:MAG: ester cyclase [Sedimentisphaerales bacterium]